MTGQEGPAGGEVLAPSGDGKLLAYTDQQRCDESGEYEPCPPGRQPGEVVKATIWRAAPRGGCPSSFSDGDSRRPGHCARVARANGELTVLDVDAGRIAARTSKGVRLLTGAGRRLLDVPVRNVSGAALSGNRLAVESRARSRSTTPGPESSSPRSPPRAESGSKTSSAGFS